MNWNLIKNHLKTWAEELKATGCTNESDYIHVFLKPLVGQHEALVGSPICAAGAGNGDGVESEDEQQTAQVESPEPFVWSGKLLGVPLRVRDGRVVIVTHVELGRLFPLRGHLEGDPRKAESWMLDGRYWDNEEYSTLDIVGVAK